LILIIDRFSDKSQLYTVSFGVDSDVLIGSWIWHKSFEISKKEFAELDQIITESVSLVQCVLNIKHPLLQRGHAEKNPPLYIRDLRDYFATRLKYRKFAVKLYEFGRRLYV
jgi:hypothetical protein